MGSRHSVRSNPLHPFQNMQPIQYRPVYSMHSCSRRILASSFYAIFLIKGEYSSWHSDVNYVRLWLLIEIVFFFSWLFASIIFVLYAYLVKFKPISKNVALMENDDNIYNDKKTDDFLRYLKSE